MLDVYNFRKNHEVNLEMDFSNLILLGKMCLNLIICLLHQRMQELVDRLQNKVTTHHLP